MPDEQRRKPPTREETMQRLAAQWNMQYEPKDDWGLVKKLGDFKLFRTGGSKRITNIVKNKDAVLESAIYLFDYKYTVSTGKSSSTYKQTVFFVDSKQLGLPQFSMKPENFLHWIGDLLGFKDIDFEDYPEFSNNYFLKGEDEEYIRHALPHQFLRFFSDNKEEAWYLEGINYFLIFYQADHLVGPRELKSFYEKGLRIYQMLKTDFQP
jgi:hypothetical protein